MSNGYSDAIKEAYSICPSGETLVDTLEIRHLLISPLIGTFLFPRGV